MKTPPSKPDILSGRLMSLDVLRGFTMFWIVGGALWARQAALASGWTWAGVLAGQMEHAAWQGVHFFDLVFPLFMFISGVSIPYAISGRLESGASRRVLAWKILRRVLILIILGWITNGLLRFDFSRLRLASVLGQVGVAYGIAAAVTLLARRRATPLVWSFGIMAAVAVVQLLVPVPGHGPGVLTPEGSINGYIDRLLLPGRLYGRVFDPEGLLCIISACALTLLGVSSGRLLRAEGVGAWRKAAILGGAGALLLSAGWAVSPWYPPIKQLWTSSFGLIAGGAAMLLMALFFLVLDGWRFRSWGTFFRVIGLNSITIYMAVRLIDFSYSATFLFAGAAHRFGSWEPALLTGATIALEWLFLWVLYKKGIFLKV